MANADYRIQTGQGLVLDDRLWQQAIGLERHLLVVRQGDAPNWSAEERALHQFLHMGTIDLQPEHAHSNGSVRAMRYSALLADRLWSMLDEERERVRVLYRPDLLLH